MLGEKMEEYVLGLLKAKDAEVKRLNERIERLEHDNKDAYEWEKELTSALKAVGRELVLVIQQDGEEYIKVRDNDWSTLPYERRDFLTLRSHIKNIRDERKKEEGGSTK